MNIKNPSLFKIILLLPYSGIRLFRTPAYVLGIFSHIPNVRHIEVYLPTFGYILADSGIFRVLTQLDIFIYIKAYSEPMAYSDIFRTVDILSQFQTLLKSNSCII